MDVMISQVSKYVGQEVSLQGRLVICMDLAGDMDLAEDLSAVSLAAGRKTARTI